MEAEQVTEKILADAKSQADKIKKEAHQKESDKQADFKQQMAEYKKQTQVLAQKAGEDKKLHLLAAARMDVAKGLLAEKRSILNQVFEDAREQMKNLPDEDYKKIMSNLMKQAVETGDEEVIVDNNETRIDHKLIKMVNRELGPGYKGNLRLSGDRQNLGAGFILRRGKINNNVSLNVLLGQAKKELEIELAKDLFEN